MSHKIFITGTDTEIGKTYISAGLLKKFSQQGLRTIGLKPISSPCVKRDGKLVNADALQLQAAATISLPYEAINPFPFEPPIAPHIAAEQLGIKLNADIVLKKIHDTLQIPADIHIIEGAGGWHMPLNATETMADFAIRGNFSIILVVGIRLGCMNHAILTYQAIQQSQLPIIGWIANLIDPHVLNAEEQIATLKQWLHTPCLGIVHHGYSSELLNINFSSIQNHIRY